MRFYGSHGGPGISCWECIVNWPSLRLRPASETTLHGFLPEPRHRIAQRPVDRLAVVATEPLLQRREPGPHGFERRRDRARLPDAGDTDVGVGLVGGEFDLFEALDRADAGEDDLD